MIPATMTPVGSLLRELCQSTGLPLGEVWVRPVSPWTQVKETDRAASMQMGSTQRRRGSVPGTCGSVPAGRDRTWHGTLRRTLTGGMAAIVPPAPGSSEAQTPQQGSLRRALTGGMAAVIHPGSSEAQQPKACPLHRRQVDRSWHGSVLSSRSQSGGAGANPGSPGPSFHQSLPSMSHVPLKHPPNGYIEASSSADFQYQFLPSFASYHTMPSFGATDEGAIQIEIPPHTLNNQNINPHQTAAPADVHPSRNHDPRIRIHTGHATLERMERTISTSSATKTLAALQNLGEVLTGGILHKDNKDDTKEQLDNYLAFGEMFVDESLIVDEKGMETIAKMQQLGPQCTYLHGQGVEGSAWERGAPDWRDLTIMHEDECLASDPRSRAVMEFFECSVAIPVKRGATVIAVFVFYGSKASDLDHPKEGCIPAKSEALALFVQTSGLLALELGQVYGKWVQDKMSLGVARAPSVHSAHLSRLPGEECADAPGADVTVQSPPTLVSPPTPSVLVWYLEKFKGQKAAPMRPNQYEFCLVALVGSFLSLLVNEWIIHELGVKAYGDNMLLAPLASFGALATLLFSAPTAPLAQPRNIFGGHIIACVTALIMDYVTNPDVGVAGIPQHISNALTPAIAISLMAATGLTHPPAGACAIIYMAGGKTIKSMGWLFVLLPALTGSFVMLVVALIVNNLSKHRKYPLFW